MHSTRVADVILRGSDRIVDRERSRFPDGIYVGHSDRTRGSSTARQQIRMRLPRRRLVSISATFPFETRDNKTATIIRLP